MRVLGFGYVTCRPPLWALSEGSVITLTGSIEEELCVGVLVRQRLLVVGCIREQRCLVSVVDLRVAHFHAVVACRTRWPRGDRVMFRPRDDSPPHQNPRARSQRFLRSVQIYLCR
jgi:hypothetical protein